ncbi:HTH-type transcriptional regulator ZntR [Thalassocella blandensis]|nr:HTH-type transcriptional regulator ZntR [Thalassocella blandensis]
MTQLYSISDLSKEFDITPRTIRFYESKGLLAPRREGQRRIYTSSDRVRLKLILRGRRLGFSLDESLEIIELYNPDNNNKKQLKTYLEKIQQKQYALAEQLKDIKAIQKSLKEAEARCIDALAN